MKRFIRRHLFRQAPGEERLYPGITNPSYIVLKALRQAIQQMVDKYIVKGAQSCLLDFGCGDSPYELILKPYVDNYIKADFEDNPHASLVLSKEGTLNIDDETVDVVTSFQVLEHVMNLDVYLGEANRVLRANGLLLLSTHGLWPYHPHPYDVHRWTHQGLKHEIEKHMFEVVDIIPCISHLAYGSLIKCHWFVHEIFNPLGRVARLFGRLTIVPFYQLKMHLEDNFVSESYRMQNAIVYVVCAKKKSSN